MARKSMVRRSKTTRRPSRRWPWLALSVIIVALIGGFAWRLASDQSGTTSGAATGAAVSSVPLPSTSDHPIALTDYPGKKLVVYFYEGST